MDTPAIAPAPEAATVPAVTTQAPPPATGGKKLTSDEVGVWRRRITAALEGTKPAIEQGKTNVARYRGEHLSGTPSADTCLVPTDFYYVEAKRTRLFYRLADIYLKPLKPGIEDAAIIFQAALNAKLGPAGVNVLPTIQQVIFDVLCPTGFGAVAIGYQTVVDGTTPVQIGTEPDPEAPPPPMLPGGVLGLSQPPAMRPIMQDAPNIVAAWSFIEHISPGDLLAPSEFVGMDFDKSPWIGQRFKEDIPDDEPGGSTKDDDRRLTPLPSGAQAGMRKQRTGYEIWYYAYLFDTDRKHHPDRIRMFTIYDDDTTSDVTVRDHPHQRYANPAGKLQNGMRGYPISPVTLRYVSDTWMVPSDCSMARNTADELSKGRTQMLQARDRGMPQWGFDSTRVDKDVQAKIEKNEIMGGVAFNGPGADATWPITKGNSPKETYNFNGICQEDLKRIWRMGDNQLGNLSESSRTATEQQIAANASQEAGEADRNVILNWYVNKVVAKYAAILQLYSTEEEFVELVGADAQRLKSVPPDVQQRAQAAGQDARVLVPWNMDTIAGPFAFAAKPNSQTYIDAAQEQKRLMDRYQFFANSPTVNRMELEREILTLDGFDPSKILQQAPPKTTPPPSMSVSLTGQDFNPLNPQSSIIMAMLEKMGEPIDPTVVATALQMAQMLPPTSPTGPGQPPGAEPQTAHGGAAAKAEPLSKHAAEATGGMQGSGSPAPVAPGGHI